MKIRTSIALTVLCAALAIACTAAAEKAGGGDVVAQVGKDKITLEELDKEAMRAAIQPYQALYDARSKVLEQMITQRLLAAEAKSRGISVDDLIAAEITAKVKPVTDSDIQGFYSQNPSRMGGRSLDELKPAIRQYLEGVNSRDANESYLAGLRAKSEVKIVLDPPRAEMVIAENDPSKGPSSAPITIVEYSDFQ